jgi:hypothetical protein
VEGTEAVADGNLLCLPYQPLGSLAGSLSAADLHVVVMGEAFVGLVHPCKIYNILSVAAPVLYIGPQPSHVSDIMEHELAGQGVSTDSGLDGISRARTHATGGVDARVSSPARVAFQHGPGYGWARHGEVDRVVEIILSARQAVTMNGRQAPHTGSSQFSKEVLLPRMIDLLEAR